MFKIAAATTGVASAAAGVSLKCFRDVNAKAGMRKLKGRKKVTVIGGGIAGVTTARMMQKAGNEVIIIDREAPGTQCSGGNGCTMGVSGLSHTLATIPTLVSTSKWIFNSSPSSVNDNRFANKRIFRDPHFYYWGAAYLQSIAYSNRYNANPKLHQDRPNIEQQTSVDVFNQLGLKEVIKFEGRLKPIWGGGVSHFSHDAVRRYLEPAQVEAIEPSLGEGDWIKAEFCDLDAHGDCHTITKSLYDEGGFRQIKSPARKVTSEGTILDNGAFIPSDIVVICAGAHGSPQIARGSGFYLPIYPLRGYSFTIPVTDPSLAPQASITTEPHDLFVTRLGNQVRFAAFGELIPVGTPTKPNDELFIHLERVIHHCFPNVDKFCDWPSRVPWTGSRPVTPDCMPIVGGTPIENVFVNTGHSFNGFRGAAHSAQLLTHLLHNDQLSPESTDYLKLYNLQRFSWLPLL